MSRAAHSRTPRICLVAPATSDAYAEVDSTFCARPPSTGLAILAACTRRFFAEANRDIQITIIENQAVGSDAISRLAGHDLLGFSVLFSNYATAVDLAAAVRKASPETKIIFGGPYAACLGSRILTNRPAVDGVAVGDGEDALWRIAAGASVTEVPNYWYRGADGSPRFSFSSRFSLSQVGVYDFAGLQCPDLSTWDARRPTYVSDPARSPIALSWIRGCSAAAERGKCAYCSVADRSVRLTPPDLAWQQVRHLRQTHGVRSFFETGDNFLVNDYPEQLLAAENRDADVDLRIYLLPKNLVPGRIGTLARLGVKEVFIGIESVYPAIMEWSRHEVDEEKVLAALAELACARIHVTAAFLFGFPGECDASLEAQRRFAERVAEFPNVRRVLMSLPIPLIGTRWFDELTSAAANSGAGITSDLRSTDMPDYRAVFELSVQTRCHASLPQILDTLHAIESTAFFDRAVGCFGGLRF